MSNETVGVIAGLLIFAGLGVLMVWLSKKLKSTTRSPETELAIEEVEARRQAAFDELEAQRIEDASRQPKGPN